MQARQDFALPSPVSSPNTPCINNPVDVDFWASHAHAHTNARVYASHSHTERQWRCHSLPSRLARPSPSHPHAIVQTAATTPRSICPLQGPDAHCIAHRRRVRIGEQASPPFRAAAPKHQGSSPQMRDLASPLKPPRLQTLAAPGYCRVAAQPGPVVSGCSRCGTAGPRILP